MYDPHATPPLSVRAQEALRRTLGRGGAFLDVGATIGATSLVAAAIVGPEGSVTAVDPQRGCVAALRANAVRNGFAQMRALEAAVGAEGGEREVIVVADALWTRLEVVAGMRGGLSDHRPVVICEMHGKNEAFCDAMEALDYRVVDLDAPGEVRPGGGNTHAFCKPR